MASVSFERAFEDTEQGSDAIQEAAKEFTTLSRQLRKASKEGNITAIKRVQSRLGDAEAALRQAVAAASAWPFRDDEEERYLNDGYAAELRSAARMQGLEIHEQEGRLLSFLSVVRVLPGKRAVRIDKKQVATLRPSHLVQLLIENRKRGGGISPPAFLEALYKVYSEIVGNEPPERLVKAGPVVRLARIYALFTSLPGVKRDYEAVHFARDLYLLEDKGPRRTRNGAKVSFHASTGARGSSGTFAFVGPDGQEVRYYGIKFTETD